MTREPELGHRFFGDEDRIRESVRNISPKLWSLQEPLNPAFVSAGNTASSWFANSISDIQPKLDILSSTNRILERFQQGLEFEFDAQGIFPVIHNVLHDFDVTGPLEPGALSRLFGIPVYSSPALANSAMFVPQALLHDLQNFAPTGFLQTGFLQTERLETWTPTRVPWYRKYIERLRCAREALARWVYELISEFDFDEDGDDW